MANDDRVPSILEQVAYDRKASGGHPLRECNRDCYGMVHTDVILALRLRGETPIGPGVNDARGLLLAREILNAEELGPVIIRSVEAVPVSGDALFVWAPTIRAWLTAHPQVSAKDLFAQGLRIKYVRELH